MSLWRSVRCGAVNLILDMCCINLSGPMLTSPDATVINATVGSNVTLICETAVVTYGVVWYFNNEPLTKGEKDQGTLTLSSLELTQSGWYTCVADNYFGKDFLLLVGGKVYLDLCLVILFMYTYSNDTFLRVCILHGWLNVAIISLIKSITVSKWHGNFV